MRVCRHRKGWKELDGCYKECLDCGVWKGYRTDPHNYDREYYHKNNTIVDGIPQRDWYWSIHKSIWDDMGIDFSNIYKVLEFGCGIGLLLWSIHRKHNIKCIGVEDSYWAYSWQKEVYGFNDSYEIIHADFEKMDYSILRQLNEGMIERSFDFIYSCHIMEHLSDPMLVIENCYGLLNSNGCFSVVVPDKEHQKSLHVHAWTYDEECLEKWFLQAGFENIKIRKTKPHNPPPQVDEYPGHYLFVSGTKL